MTYRTLFRRWRIYFDAVLAIGADTASWVKTRGVPEARIFPFAYFLPHRTAKTAMLGSDAKPFRLIYVGQIIPRKRVDLLLDALSRPEVGEFSLTVIGGGPLESVLKARAEMLLGQRLCWVGQLPIDQVSDEIAAADCLVLPSRHDGWGAVVSEALITGTPAICSDRCGAAEVVRASGHGGVFSSGNAADLARCIRKAIIQGRLSGDDATRLASWAQSLTTNAGAAYSEAIAEHLNNGAARPSPPWRAGL